MAANIRRAAGRFKRDQTKKNVYIISIELEGEKKIENLDKMVIIFRRVGNIIMHLVRCTRALKYKNVVLL